ncbi:MAG: tryptophan synthase subunit alpha [Bdellovibrionales bacterium]
MLAGKIRALRRKKKLLLMPHMVLGFPSYAENKKLVGAMVEAGAEIIEMQIPFSEPMSDGPVILKANDEALKRGATTEKCLTFAREVCAQYPDTIFIFMTYYNIPFVYGLKAFAEKARKAGVLGLIVPDLPPEEAKDYLAACKKADIDPIFIFTPTNTDKRLTYLSRFSKGMVYCVGRKGVTGLKTKIDKSLAALVKKYKRATKLPLALGFGIQSKEDIAALPKDVDIAVLGTKILTLHQEKGIAGVGRFLKTARG